VQAHLDLAARRRVGMHFGTFQLTDDGIDEPIEALVAARAASGLSTFPCARVRRNPGHPCAVNQPARMDPAGLLHVAYFSGTAPGAGEPIGRSKGTGCRLTPILPPCGYTSTSCCQPVRQLMTCSLATGPAALINNARSSRLRITDKGPPTYLRAQSGTHGL
jgi:hypothetical protein